jgi:probable rRNA maturation factor
MSGTTPALKLDFSIGAARAAVPTARSFHAWIASACQAQRVRRAGLALRIVEAAEASALNQRFRGRDYAPNVLSFPSDLKLPGGVRWLGDIAICREVVLAEALSQHKAARAHFAHLAIHGALHLLGHDHVQAPAAERMEALEVRLLAGFGIANPYCELAPTARV